MSKEKALFDYGCGRGQDIELLLGLSVSCSGWDPVHRPHTPKVPADLVNLGYVINVIEDSKERMEAVHDAWSLCRSLLVVSAQIEGSTLSREMASYADGILTSRNTFQKYYTQTELRVYLEDTLGADAIPAAPGVFYVFKDEAEKQAYLGRRYQRRSAVPRKKISELLFEQNQDVLDPFLDTLARLGRLPIPEELSHSSEIINRFGSLKRAFALVKRVTGTEPWEDIARRRTEDLLVYLALARFHRRPLLSRLPLTTQHDVKAFFGTYDRACREADALLFRAGNVDAVNEACQGASVGQLVDNALLIHRSALDQLDPLLRAYEGCARALLGEFEEADVIKLHRFSGKVSYLAYQDFDSDPQPALRLRVKVSLRSLDVAFFDYSNQAEPARLEDKLGLLPIEGCTETSPVA